MLGCAAASFLPFPPPINAAKALMKPSKPFGEIDIESNEINQGNINECFSYVCRRTLLRSLTITGGSAFKLSVTYPGSYMLGFFFV